VNIGIAPLMMVFILVVIARVSAALR